mmetsp:Transcript_32396/g.91796  ORF Transcript_32396/g.91796 Transcript_32396/m.91796 type:complete len:539 (+) Transcript_32396:236-1852(+)|eukprot:CAMPEP_0117685768 /NCGR_PEP_ID=MMETSP0804-20121206/21973_1 /TAXON_ID=1074897 /ORGANISM="Tetraselmis astigmatica, Strain CCMP880" /LENGTH=538 /DNA_ID=CAMNT_0005497177 /DNA_START=218 /DNA_END=1834 /DNA_ORIENTATION=+
MGIIPNPVYSETLPGSFVLPPQPVITFNCDEVAGVAKQAASSLESRYGSRTSTQSTLQSEASAVGLIHLSVDAAVKSLTGLDNSMEGYELVVSEGSVRISGISACGVFYGLQSFLQLLPPSLPPEGEDISINSIKVFDSPRFQWRGALLDVGRHFFPVPFIKKFLDILAMHKLNVFHWHLTEDQGWRPEVKQLKRLTEVGSWRSPDRGQNWYGGCYTQEELKEIVAYAAERFIHVMPEIELPGHCCASLAAYPDLSCSGTVTEVPFHWGIHEHIYCAGNDKVFDFLEIVLGEMIDIFPFEYIHIGGDEAPKNQWKQCEKCQKRIHEEGLQHEGELQSWFIQRISDFLRTKGRKIMGWDEILEGGLVEGATVMSWRGTRGGVMAAKLGHNVVMTPTSHCYFDYRQSTRPDEPGAWYAMLPIETVYEFDPMLEPLPPPPEVVDGQPSAECVAAEDVLNEKERGFILGGQANVWTEYISDEATVEYMLLPRLCAMAEALWSRRESKDWDDFRVRMDDLLKHFDVSGFGYCSLQDLTTKMVE